MSKPIWIEAELVLAIHNRQFVEHGGAVVCVTTRYSTPHLARFPCESADVVELAAVAAHADYLVTRNVRRNRDQRSVSCAPKASLISFPGRANQG